MKNKTFAIEAAPAAMPPNPNMAAIMAITKKIIDQRNIRNLFNVKRIYGSSVWPMRYPRTLRCNSNLHTMPLPGASSRKV
jgi:hypothetical protein